MTIFDHFINKKFWGYIKTTAITFSIGVCMPIIFIDGLNVKALFIIPPVAPFNWILRFELLKYFKIA